MLVNIDIDQDTLNKLKQLADKEGRSRKAQIEHLLREAVKESPWPGQGEELHRTIEGQWIVMPHRLGYPSEGLK